jgi:hypothetical protein
MGTVHRWLRDGILAGEQLTPGAPWRIVLTDEIRDRLAGTQAPEGWVGVSEAGRRLGVSKSLVAYSHLAVRGVVFAPVVAHDAWPTAPPCW